MHHLLTKIFNSIENAKGKPLLVGGCVRDQLLGIASKDIDIEVYDLEYDQLSSILAEFGRTVTVGRSFGIIKLRIDNEEFDFSLPRLNSHMTSSQQGISVQHDRSLSPHEAAQRRDFTINSMARTLEGKLIDPFNGQADLHDKVLRATSKQFAEDPLRVLRGMQFAARFEMRAHEDTAMLCHTLSPQFSSLPIERIWTEFFKLCTMGEKPSLGIQFLIDTQWLANFPELHAMHNSPQDPEWHPEGCVLTHTMHCMDAAAIVADRQNLSQEDRLILILAMLCHDIGKPVTLAKNSQGRFTNHGHAEKGAPIATSFLESIGASNRVIERIVPLVKYHMVHVSLEPANINERFVRRLSRNLGPAKITELAMVMESDKSGRPPLPKGIHPTTVSIVELAEHLDIQDQAPDPLLLGRHLIDLGIQPGPLFSKILDSAYEAQLNGDFSSVEQGILWLQQSQLLTNHNTYS